MDSFQNIITELEDQTKQKDAIRKALTICGYPSLTTQVNKINNNNKMDNNKDREK